MTRQLTFWRRPLAGTQRGSRLRCPRGRPTLEEHRAPDAPFRLVRDRELTEQEAELLRAAELLQISARKIQYKLKEYQDQELVAAARK